MTTGNETMRGPADHRYAWEHGSAWEGELPCPTCLVEESGAAAGGAAGHRPEPVGLPVAICPTCGVASVEWGLATQIDAVIDEMLGWERLDAAVRALD